MICDNNTTLHYTIIGNKDDKKNFLYDQLVKSILYNFLDKLRSEFGQEDKLTENRGLVH